MPAARNARPYVHHPIEPVQQAHQAAMRKILRPNEVQAKPDIGENDSKYEQETGHVVDRVAADLSVPAISGMPTDVHGGVATIQRLENEEPEEELQRQPEVEDEEPIQAKLIQRQPDNEEEQEPVQAKRIQRQMADTHGIRRSRFGYVGLRVKVQQAEIHRILRSIGAQAKVTVVGQPNDKYEQEADRVADRVMAMPDPKLQRQPENEEEEETLQTKPLTDQITPLVQRQEEPPEEEEEETAQRQPIEEDDEELLAKEQPGQTPQVNSGIESRINSMKGGGQSLDPAARSFFEPRFGHDFSHVRVHNNARAVHVASSVNARAFTLGDQVAFGASQYTPETGAGRHLLAHELTHVIQQKAGSDNKQGQGFRLHTAGNDLLQCGFFGDLWEGAKSAASAVWSGVKTVGGAVWEGVKTAGSWAWSVLKAIGKWGWNVLKSAGAWVWDLVTEAPIRIWRLLKHVGSGDHWHTFLAVGWH